MKGFLKSKTTMFVLISLFIVVSVLLAAFCIRPTAVGYTYSGEVNADYEQKITYEYHFNTSSKLTQTMKAGAVEIEKEYWYFEYEGHIVKVGLYEDYTKDEFLEKKQEIIENWNEFSEKKYDTKINPFFIKEGQEMLLSIGSIITVAVLGVVDFVLLILSIISIVKVNKNKTKKETKKA